MYKRRDGDEKEEFRIPPVSQGDDGGAEKRHGKGLLDCRHRENISAEGKKKKKRKGKILPVGHFVKEGHHKGAGCRGEQHEENVIIRRQGADERGDEVEKRIVKRVKIGGILKKFGQIRGSVKDDDIIGSVVIAGAQTGEKRKKNNNQN